MKRHKVKMQLAFLYSVQAKSHGLAMMSVGFQQSQSNQILQDILSRAAQQVKDTETVTGASAASRT